jgi:hypothetical protein
MSGDDNGAQVIPFAFSRVRPTQGEVRELGLGKLAKALGITGDHLNGKFCRRCQGIWFGLMLEVECPSCGNRHG